MLRVLRPLAAATGAFAAAALVELRGRRRAARAVADTTTRLRQATPTAAEQAESALDELLGEREVTPLPDPGTPVTDVLHARLEPGDREAIAAIMGVSAAEAHAAAAPATQLRLELNHAAAFGPAEVRGRLGLLAAMPPDEVHSMARAWQATGGDTYLADLVVAALEAAGCPVPDGGTVLDFGSSSGRVLRILAAARPDLRCIGCDPNEDAIAWAAANLPGEYVVSPLAPPLDLPDASLDAVYAISIWSHFAERPALDWLTEMARVVRPGGGLALTTHGWDALATGRRRGTIARGTVAAAGRALVTHGHHFVDVFGPDGDWGVRDPGWGDAYVTADWLVEHLDGSWSLDLLWPAAIDGSQDLLVLRRR